MEDLRNLDGVEDVHDIHIWALTAGKNTSMMHMTINRDDPKDEILRQALHNAKPKPNPNLNPNPNPN